MGGSWVSNCCSKDGPAPIYSYYKICMLHDGNFDDLHLETHHQLSKDNQQAITRNRNFCNFNLQVDLDESPNKPLNLVIWTKSYLKETAHPTSTQKREIETFLDKTDMIVLSVDMHQP